jgi:hypothetical protein
MMTIEEYEREHNPKKLSRIEVIIGLALFVSFELYFICKAIVDCWPILRSNLIYILSILS